MKIYKVLSSLEELFLDLDLNPYEINIICTYLIKFNICYDSCSDIHLRNVKDWILFSIESIENQDIIRILSKLEKMCADDLYIQNADNCL